LVAPVAPQVPTPVVRAEAAIPPARVAVTPAVRRPTGGRRPAGRTRTPGTATGTVQPPPQGPATAPAATPTAPRPTRRPAGAGGRRFRPARPDPARPAARRLGPAIRPAAPH